jgi:RHS repeat-associated protein
MKNMKSKTILPGARTPRAPRPLAAAAVLGLALTAAVPLPAQTHANAQRGFSPEKVFQSGEIDHVALFNGNLTLTLPLGPSYPVNGQFSYGITLTYNSNCWDFQERLANSTSYVQALPNRRSNAGMGWMLSFGRLEPPGAPTNDSGRYLYVGEDGGEHLFYPTLHEGDAADAAVTGVLETLYTRDGTYLRLRRMSDGTFQLELPDGTLRRLGSDRRVSRIEDRFGNFLSIDYSQPGQWGLTDNHGRIHTIYFRSLPQDGTSVEVVDHVDLAAWDDPATPPTSPDLSIYSFSYTAATIPRAWPDAPGNLQNDPVTTDSLSVQLLTGVTLPDGSSYSMPVADYYTSNPSANSQLAGRIKGLRLPTRGKLEWTYTTYRFPTESDAKSYFQDSLGVATRTLTDPVGGSAAGTWTYDATLTLESGQPAPLRRELVNVVTNPLGDQTKYYFSVYAELGPSDGYTAYDYGLPFTRKQPGDGAGRLLSSQSYDCAVGGTSCVLKRTSYVRYERDRHGPDTGRQADRQNLNRRLETARTVYNDDGNRFADTNYSDFDGLGHYRRQETGGNFGAGDVHTTIKGYNYSRGTYKIDPATDSPVTGTHTWSIWPAGSPWLLGLFWDHYEIEGGYVEQSLHCFDPATGFLNRRRVLTQPGQLGVDDVLVAYGSNGTGSVTSESYHGGDGGTLDRLGDTCAVGLPAAQYRMSHTYQYGTLATSRYTDAAGNALPAPLSFLTVDRTIDRNTGLVSSSRDTAGVATSFEYDRMGRLVWEKPGSSSWTQYAYTVPTAAAPTAIPKVQVLRRNDQGTTLLADSSIEYEGFGRVWREKRTLPGSVGSTRVTQYDGLGQKTSVSEWQAGTPSKLTQFLSYDAFGRPGTVRPPDGSGHDVTFSYLGARQVARTAKVATGYDAATGNPVETSATTTELYDRQGRLWQVTEPSGMGGANVTTTYGYDAMNRLRSTSTPATVGGTSVNQSRSFIYGARGFLNSESHPEKGGTAGGGSVSYLDYDSRGHARRRIDGPNDLTFTYDKGERLIEIRETGGAQRVLKTFSYAGSNGTNDLRRGKLQVAARNNYVTIGGLPYTVQVAETYTYGGRHGWVSKRDTQVFINGAADVAFSLSIGSATASGYDALGNVILLNYPQCTVSACAGPADAARAVSSTYDQGLLASVTGYSGTLSYHSNGMVNQVPHANGVTDNYTIATDAMARPASIASVRGTTTLWSTGGYRYDGSGNVAKIGSAWFTYDRVSRLASATLFDGASGGGAQITQSYTVDPYGNITAIGGTVSRNTPTSPWTNRLNGTGATYDTAGNLKTWNGATYEWDAFNQMSRMVNGTEDWTYMYTADDERLWSFKPGMAGTIPRADRFTLRGLDGKVLRETVTSGYNWAAATVEDYVYRGGQLLAAETAQGTQHFHLDHLGTPRLITNGSGQQMSYHLYYPFGEEATAFNQDTERMKFTGHERDLASLAGAGDDLDYMHARFCSPLTGRFLSTDPKLNGPAATQSPQLWNRFSYAAGNPMKLIDPDGRDAMVFVVGPGDNLFERFGHAAIYVKSGNEGRGVSFGGSGGFERGVRGFIRHYTDQGRTVTVFILKTTPEEDRRMLSFMKSNAAAGNKSGGLGADLMLTQNCANAVCNVLSAGGVLKSGETADGAATGFSMPSELESSLRNGELSDDATVVLEFDPEADAKAQSTVDSLTKASMWFRSLGYIN